MMRRDRGPNRKFQITWISRITLKLIYQTRSYMRMKWCFQKGTSRVLLSHRSLGWHLLNVDHTTDIHAGKRPWPG